MPDTKPPTTTHPTTNPIAVDAMGGDLGPGPTVVGAVQAAREKNLAVILVGDDKAVRAELARVDTKGLSIEVQHATEVVEMTDHPAKVMRQKTDSSMAVCFELIRQGRASAMISTGNTGAVMAFALRTLKRLKGVERPAIASVVPAKRGELVMLDMGANVDCKPTHLVQFALMGEAYSRIVQGKNKPRVGLLSNGTEPSKGNELTREAHALLSQTDLNYGGYVEGRDIFSGDWNVVVHDGFVGNVVLKTIEGAAEAIAFMIKDELEKSLLAKTGALLIKQALSSFKKRLDYAEYGGAPLLGVGGVAIICHGSSPAKAIKNAVAVASMFARSRLNDEIVEEMRRYDSLFGAPAAAEVAS